MTVVEEIVAGIGVVSPRGKIFNVTPVIEDVGREMGVYQELKRTVERLVKSGVTRIVLDMSGVPAVDSAGLGGIVLLRSMVGKSNGRLVLCRLTPDVESVFVMTDLTRFFEVCPSREEALESISGRKS